MTSLFKSYHPKKNWNAIAEKYLSKRTKAQVLKDLAGKWNLTLEQAQVKWGEAEMTVEWIRSVWAEKSQRALHVGTHYHNYREFVLSNNENVKYNPIVDGKKKSYDLSNLSPGIYPELILYSHKYKIAGQADYVKIKENGKIIIRDYKTSDKIVMEPTAYYRPDLKKKTIEKFISPISHLPTINYNDYALQLSGYGYILEMNGYEVQELVVEHIKFKDKDLGIVKEVVDVPVPYLKQEVKAVFNHHLSIIRSAA